jgi:hypothetical protein
MNASVGYLALLGAGLFVLTIVLVLRHLMHAGATDVDDTDEDFAEPTGRLWVKRTMLLYSLALLVAGWVVWGSEPLKSVSLGDVGFLLLLSDVFSIVLLLLFASIISGWRTGRRIGANIENSPLIKVACIVGSLLTLLFAPVGLLVLIGTAYPSLGSGTAEGCITICGSLWLASGLAGYSRGAAYD